MRLRTRRSVLSAVVAAAVLVPSFAAAQGIEEPRIPLRTKLAELNTLRTEFETAVNAKDAAAAASIYAPHAIYQRADGTVLRGADAIREALASEAEGWGRFTITSDTVQMYGNTAVDIGSGTMEMADGSTRSMRYTAVLRRDLNGWKLVADAETPVR